MSSLLYRALVSKMAECLYEEAKEAVLEGWEEGRRTDLARSDDDPEEMPPSDEAVKEWACNALRMQSPDVLQDIIDAINGL